MKKIVTIGQILRLARKERASKNPRYLVCSESYMLSTLLSSRVLVAIEPHKNRLA